MSGKMRVLLAAVLALALSLVGAGIAVAADGIEVSPGGDARLEAYVDAIDVEASGADRLRFMLFVGALQSIGDAEDGYTGDDRTRVFNHRVDLADVEDGDVYEVKYFDTVIARVIHDGDDTWSLTFTTPLLDYMHENFDWSYGDETTWLFAPGEEDVYWWDTWSEEHWDTHRHYRLTPHTAYWPFEVQDDEEDEAFDSFGGYHAQIVGATFEDDEGALPGSGGALAFDSDRGDHVLATGLPHSDSVTVSLWVKHSGALDPSNPGLIHGAPAGESFSTEPDSKSVGLWVTSGGELWGRLVQGGGVQKNFPVSENLDADTWYHVALTADSEAGEGKLYLDGREIASIEYDGTLQDWSDFGIGRQGDESWNGLIDDVRLYRRALAPADIAALLPHRLDVDVEGAGYVEVDGMELDELSTSLYFARETTVQLEAFPVAGWTFTGWEVEVDGEPVQFTSGEITLDVSGVVRATARFASDYSLSITKRGEGTVLVDGDEVTLPYLEAHEEDEEVQLEAEAAPGWTFVKWVVDGDDVEDPDDPMELVIDGQREVEAVFQRVAEERGELWITPRTLNLRARGRWIGARLRLSGIDLNALDPGSVELTNAEGDESVAADWGRANNGEMMLKFDWARVAELLEPGDAVEIVVYFRMSGRAYEVRDWIRVINPGPPMGGSPGRPF